MQAIIVYATKYGSVKKCAELLKQNINVTVDLVDIKNSVPDIKDYDIVIIGGSIYFGKIQKKITDFCKANLSALLNKKVALFICAGQNDEKCLRAAFLKLVYDHALYKEILGGQIQPEKLSFIEKLIISKAAKIDTGKLFINLEKISEFSSKINASIKG